MRVSIRILLHNGELHSSQVWMYAASLLMERLSSALSCSVGKRTWRRRCGGREGIVFQDLELWRGWNWNPQCTGDAREPCGGKPCQQSDTQCNVWISLQYCWNALFGKLHHKHCFFFSESSSRHDGGNAEFDLKITANAPATTQNYVCRSLKVCLKSVKCGLTRYLSHCDTLLCSCTLNLHPQKVTAVNQTCLLVQQQVSKMFRTFCRWAYW